MAIAVAVRTGPFLVDFGNHWQLLACFPTNFSLDTVFAFVQCGLAKQRNGGPDIVFYEFEASVLDCVIAIGRVRDVQLLAKSRVEDN